MSQRRLPAEVYWRRRLLVAAGAILLVWMASQAFGGSSGGGNDPAPAPLTAPSSASPTPDAIKTQGVVRVKLAANERACDPEKVRVTPTVPSGQFTKGPVDINLVVSSTAQKACTLTAKNADLLVVISANKTAVYDSTVCKESLLNEPVVLSPGWASEVAVKWSGRGSGSGCTGKEGFATQGRYLLQLGTLGGEPGETTFTIDDKPQPQQTKQTKQTKKSDNAKPKAKNTTPPADE